MAAFTVEEMPAGRTWVSISVGTGYVYFDIQNGVAGTSGNIAAYGIKPLDGGWYEISVAPNIDANGDAYLGIATGADSSGASYQGDGASGVLVRNPRFIRFEEAKSVPHVLSSSPVQVIDPYYEYRGGVALGDSFTANANYTGEINNTSADLLVADKGISGQALTLIVGRFQSDAAPFSPSFVLLMGGINDINQASSDPNATMQSQVQSFVSLCNSINAIPVLTNLPPENNSVSWTTQKQGWMDTYNSWISNYAYANGYVLLDLKDLLSTDGLTLSAAYDSGDHLHPNASGYKVIGDKIVSLLDGISLIPSTCMFPMTGNTAETATFNLTSQNTYTLTVTQDGTGSGTVTTTPTGTTFTAGTPVTLTATPAAGSTFSGWSGGCSGTSPTCQLTMNSSITADATFILLPPDTTPPTTPGPLTATTVSSSQINLTWSASTDNVGVAGYNIYRNGTQIATVTTTTYSDTGLLPSTTYTYSVSAYDAAGNTSSMSASASATTTLVPDITPPTVPASLVATAISSSQVNLSWAASTDPVVSGQIASGVAGYNIYRNGTLVASVTGTGYSDTGLLSSGTYTYNVSAYDAAGNNSDPTTAASVTTPAGSITYISNLQWVGTPVNGWGPVETDMSNGEQAKGDGSTISLHGVKYAKGLGVHASSNVTYNLAGQYSRFVSDIGIDDETDGSGSVIFQVWGDGTKLYDSGIMGGASATQNVNVSVAGVNTLQLIVLVGNTTG